MIIDIPMEHSQRCVCRCSYSSINRSNTCTWLARYVLEENMQMIVCDLKHTNMRYNDEFTATCLLDRVLFHGHSSTRWKHSYMHILGWHLPKGGEPIQLHPASRYVRLPHPVYGVANATCAYKSIANFDEPCSWCLRTCRVEYIKFLVRLFLLSARVM